MKPFPGIPSSCARGMVALLLAAAALPGMPLPAQADVPLALSAVQQQLARIAPDMPAPQLSFAVDSRATRLDFDIGSSASGLILAITGPAGEQISPSTVGGLGGSYAALPATGAAATGPAIYPLSTAGIRHRFQLPSLGAGTYTLRASAVGLTDQHPIVAQLLTDSPVTANLLFTETGGIVGRRSILCAAVIDGAAPLAGANVTAQLLDPQQQVSTITLLDDGGENDGQAGDGMYCNGYTPAAAGTHAALADIRATDSAGQQIRRQAAVTLAVDGEAAAFTGGFSDHGVDLDADGRFDYVALVAEVDVAVAGTYRVLGTLRTAGGVQFEGATDQVLGAGTGQAEVRLDGLRLQALHEPGPYTVERIDLLLLDNGRARLADVLPQPGQTQAYRLDQLERAAIMLAGATTDRGVDTNANGLFDVLEVLIEVDVETPGFYQFSARLTDRNSRPIELVASSASLPAGRSLLTLGFDGRRIGAGGIDGPYIVDSFLIYGAGASLTESGAVARTAAYRYTEFEAGTANPADVNADGQVDCTDIALVRANFGKRAGQPGFDPRTDVTADGSTDIRDLTLVARALPIGTRCQ